MGVICKSKVSKALLASLDTEIGDQWS